MTRDEVIAEARRLFESEKTLRIRDDAPVIVTNGGRWVAADVFVRDDSLGDPDCRFCQGMPGYPCENHSKK